MREFLNLEDHNFWDAVTLMQAETMQSVRNWMELYLPAEGPVPMAGGALKTIDRQLHEHVRRVFGKCGVGMDIQTPEMLEQEEAVADAHGVLDVLITRDPVRAPYWNQRKGRLGDGSAAS